MDQPGPKFVIPPTPADKPSWFSTHHIIAYVFVFAVLAAAVSGIYYWQIVRSIPAYEPVVHKDPTANWKTYTNTEYGFEFKYPNDWEINLDPDGIGFISAKLKQEMTNPIFEGNLDLFIYWESLLNTATPGTKEDKIISGNKFIYYSGGVGYETGNYEIKSGKNIITISGDPKVVEPVLSTFKFIDPDEVKSYTSQKHGVTFTYLATQGDPVIEEENKIYVDGKEGQYVEFFEKNPSESLKEAIQRRFLSGISSSDCWVEIIPDRNGSGFEGSPNYPESFEMATISYPLPNEEGEPWFALRDKCPEYSATNGITYFLYDKNHPSKYFYFSIGQYAISAQPDSASGYLSWQDTFRVIDDKLIDNGGVCIQVITSAKNKTTGEVKEFPTPCDVPEGWEKL